LRTGLRVRDAWLQVFDKEPVRAVLSADEHNPFTRLPVVLARARRIPTTYCDHGALNLVPSIRQHCSDTYLARGEMAHDYWVNWCGLPAERVVVGAPPEGDEAPLAASQAGNTIVFFSEPYELGWARVERFYKEVLPPLCALARNTGRKLIIKLHPFESLRGRTKMIRALLSPEQTGMVEIISGPLTPELLQSAWCGLTVESSVVLDCALRGVPCFLCDWFAIGWFEYARQFARYGVGYVLNSPDEILGIPGLIEHARVMPAVRERLKTPMDSQQLNAVLSGSALG